jgi:hypothetical protein
MLVERAEGCRLQIDLALQRVDGPQHAAAAVDPAYIDPLGRCHIADDEGSGIWVRQQLKSIVLRP